LALAPGGASAEAERALSFEDAIAIALSDGPDLPISARSVAGAERKADATRALRWPKLAVAGNVYLWDSALELNLAPPGIMQPPGTGTATVRERVTSNVSATLSMPLSAQLVIGRLVALDQAGVGVAEQDHRQARLQIATGAAEAYIRLLQTRAAQSIADAARAQIQAQLDRARILLEGGVLQRVDVMRLEAAVAAARLREIEAGKAARVVEANLALLLGWPRGTAIAVSDRFPEQPKPATTPDGSAVRGRPDLAASRLRAEQARRGVDVALAELFPNVSAVSTFQHNEGGGTFQPKNAWYAGLTLQWDVWDWGYDWNNYKRASVTAEQARLAAGRLADRAGLEVDNAALDAQTSYQALDAAAVGLRAAEEALRIQNQRYAEGKATTTDLLAAETEATTARLAVSTARFAYFASIVALARAAGRMPEELLSEL
jgi:outer membrane protein TolC